MKRKNIICVASSIFIIILLVCVIIKLTCIVNLDDGSSTSISDAEYLEVSDLRKLYIFIDDDEKNLLEELAKNMILDSYYNNGFNDQYTTIVSNDIFKRLNPNNTGNKFDFELISWDGGQVDYASTLFWYGDLETRMTNISDSKEALYPLPPAIYTDK